MVTLPKGFVAIKYPGYFWHLTEKKLYSMKVDGILKPLKVCKPNYWNKYFSGYQVSVQGSKRLVEMSFLMNIQMSDSIIPVKSNKGV